MFETTLLKEKENQILDFLFYNKDPIKAGDIADRMKIPHSTLNSVLQRLDASRMIEWEKYGSVSLTSSGYETAAHLSNHHFIIEHFLNQTLDLSDTEAHDQALHLAGRVDCKLIDAICEKFGISKSKIQTHLCDQRDYSFTEKTP
ncbi:MAG: metal-dependent transcriptional regulator [Promethearchaeota archaeon]